MAVSYKALFLIPVLLLVVSLGILVGGYLQTGEWFLRGIDLKGGTAITLPGADVEVLKEGLAGFGARVREVGGFGGQSALVEVEAGIDQDQVLQAVEALGFSTAQATIHTIGSSLGQNFWLQAQIGIVMAFVLMGIVVFALFRTAVPTLAVIFAAVTDIVATLAAMQLLGVSLSLAGLAALLMLIGYSVDTDILLTTRVLKGEAVLRERLVGAVKTGLTMSLTTMGALLVVLLVGLSDVISQIAIVLLLGIAVDIVVTWLGNAGMLRWYMERRGV